MEKNNVRSVLISYGIDVMQARKNIGLTQLELPRLVPCSQAIISHIECGYMLPPPHIESAAYDFRDRRMTDG